MFMNYSKHYQALITRAQTRSLDTYTENHHIIPRCLGGSDDKSNLVRLTPEEHYLAHQLLIKIYPNIPALVNAAAMMIPNRPSNKLYGWLKRKFAETQSKNQTGNNNSQFGSRWIHNNSLKQSKKIKQSEALPEGWSEGRRMNFDIKPHLCRVCHTPFEQIRLEVYCSSTCKKHDRSQAHKHIDENLDAIIDYYQQVWSIDQTLKKFGVPGVRAGNNYLSDILKNRNIYVRPRTGRSKKEL
jgi:hypothetical protein